MADVIVKDGQWEYLPPIVRWELMRNHLEALSQRKVVILSKEEISYLAKRYAESTGKYPWELTYWIHQEKIGASVGKCSWKYSPSSVRRTLPGVDDFFVSPNLRSAARLKEKFLEYLGEDLADGGKIVELGRVHNLFKERDIRKSVTREGLRKVAIWLKKEIETNKATGKRVGILTFTPASFYDPFGRGSLYLIDPGLAIGDDVLRQLVGGGLTLYKVFIATSLSGVEALPCCGEYLKEKVIEIWKLEREKYKEYGARFIRYMEYETTDDAIITMKWPYDNASRTWRDYSAQFAIDLSDVKRALSLMKRSRLAPFPWRLNLFIF